jgi:Domain of unknown function (DUF3883)
LPDLNINGRRVTVGADVAAAFDLIERDYAGRIVQDNGQAEGPFVAFGFPSTPVQVGVRLNKHKLTVYARERTPHGELLSDAVPGLVVEVRYDSTMGRPVHSIKNGLVPYLRLADAPVVRAEVTPDNLRAVLDACLGKAAPPSSSVPLAEAAAPPMAEDSRKTPRARRPMTPEDLLSQLDRRSELGRQGEEVAVRHERDRLHKLGCTAPDDHVEHVALEDVGLGYDIRSTWPGHERCIEVKTSSAAGADFYVSVNERQVLKDLGDKGWIYRVAPGASGLEVVDTICNPEKCIPEDRFTAQVWRVRWP